MFEEEKLLGLIEKLANSNKDNLDLIQSLRMVINKQDEAITYLSSEVGRLHLRLKLLEDASKNRFN